MSAVVPGTRIDLLRHGDTGRTGYRGQLDDPLTEAGWAQLRSAVEGGHWDAVVASPLERCAAFARELAEARGLPLALDARLMECHFGHWQGVPVDEIAASQGDALARFWADPAANPPPGAETLAVFGERLVSALDAIAGKWPGRRVLVVTHGGAIRWLRCLLDGRGVGDMAGIEVPHASLHAIEWPLPSCSTAPIAPAMARS